MTTVKGMEEVRPGAWAWVEGGGGGACKGRRDGGGSWEERREGEEAGERHWPGEKSFMPKEGLSDEESFDGIVLMMGGRCLLAARTGRKCQEESVCPVKGEGREKGWR